MLERCLYQRDVCIREMSVLERCLYWRGVCILESCLYIREMSVLERCLYWRGVCIRKLSHKLSLITSRATVVLVWPGHESSENSFTNSCLSTLINSRTNVVLFDQDMRVARTLIETLNSH